MESGVHECARQILRSFALLPAARSMIIINDGLAVLLHHGEE